jgi:bifunctional non-homologous end joining protein LigD
VWLEPVLVAQISFQEWTAEGKLRQPVFLGIRDDKAAKDVTMPVALRLAKT